MTLLLTFIQKAIGQGVAILFGASGELVTEKSGKPRNSGNYVHGWYRRTYGCFLL